MTDLMPPSSTRLERALDKTAGQRMTAIPLPHRTLFSPDKCPEHLLHILAWSLSVDVWRDSWPVAVKRQVIRSAKDQHRQKGTLASVYAAVRSFGAGINITEWFEPGGSGVPHTFKAEFTPSATIPNTSEFQRDVAAAINAVKPLYAWYDLIAGVSVTGRLRTVSACRATTFRRLTLGVNE